MTITSGTLGVGGANSSPGKPRKVSRPASILEALRRINRAPEIIRCMRVTAQWLPLTLAYLQFRNLRYPYRLFFRHMPAVLLKEPQDVRVFWQIFLHRCYRVKASDRTIIDAGANIGLFTLYASRKAKEAKIFAVEPFPETFERCAQLIRDNDLDDRVKTLRCALGNCEGVRMMRSGPVPSASKQVHPLRPGQPGFEVPTTTLSQIVRSINNDEIDLLKMDIEGGEYEVIMTTPHEVLRRIRRIVVEYHGDVGPYTTEGLFTYLLQAGFELRFYVQDANKVGLMEMERSATSDIVERAAVA